MEEKQNDRIFTECLYIRTDNGFDRFSGFLRTKQAVEQLAALLLPCAVVHIGGFQIAFDFLKNRKILRIQFFLIQQIIHAFSSLLNIVSAAAVIFS
jgi:hypothetical protein